MKRESYSGGRIDWPPAHEPYWWNPQPHEEGLLFLKRDDPNQLWTLYFDPCTERAYVMYWET